MHHFFEAITNTAGDSLIGYFARVINRTTQNTVPLSSDENGTPIVVVSGVENMAKTDEYGNLSLYVEPGTYHLDIYAPNTTTFLFRVSDVAMNSSKGDAGPPGDSGPSDATFLTLVELKAINPVTYPSPRLAAVSGSSSGVANGPFTYQTGNFTGRTDVVVLDTVPVTTGALVRQPAEGLTAKAIGTPTILNLQHKLNQVVSVLDFGAHGQGVSHDDTGAFADILATGRTPYVPLPDSAYAVANVPITSRSEIRGEKTGLGAGPKIAVGSSNSAAFRSTASEYISEVRMSNLSVLGAPGVTNARFIDKTSLSDYLAYSHFENIETHRNLRFGYRANFIFAVWKGCRDGYLSLGLDNLVGTDTSHTAIQSLPASWAQGNEPNINKAIDSHFFGSFGGEAALDFRYGHRLGIYGCDFEGLEVAGLAAFGVGGIEIAGGWSEAVNGPAVFRIMGYPGVSGSGSQVHIHDYTIRMTGTAPYVADIEASSSSRLDIENVAVFFADSAKRLANTSALIGMNSNVRAFTGLNEVAAEAAPNFHLNMHRDAYNLGGRRLLNGAVDNGITAVSLQNQGGLAATGGFMSGPAVGITVGTTFVTVATSLTGYGGKVRLSGAVASGPFVGAQFSDEIDWQGSDIKHTVTARPIFGATSSFQVVGNDLQMKVDANTVLVFATLIH